VKRAEGLPQILLEPSHSKFINYPAVSPNKLHFISTTIKLHPIVERGLLLGLKFMPYPKHQHEHPLTLLTAYVKDVKSSLDEIAHQGLKFTFKESDSLWTMSEQYTVREILHHPQWTSLHRDHDIMKSDKNIDTTIVTHSWSILHCKWYLEDTTFYISYKTFNSQEELDTFNKTINSRIYNRLVNLQPQYRLLTPDPDVYFPNFYVVPKVHKSPIRTRPITGAFNSGTT
jgi:hypothetical protein